jgi:class 3 adenylate cyclase
MAARRPLHRRHQRRRHVSPGPDSYTPKHLAEKILISKSAREGKRKQVTVVFADLKGSMELLDGRDPRFREEVATSTFAGRSKHRWDSTG